MLNMLTTKQAIKILNCSISSVAPKMANLGIYPIRESFSNGKRNFYPVTEERLRELIAERQKDPIKIALQQTRALGALESAMNQRRGQAITII